MKFFLDENFPKAAAALLEESGHECLDPRGTEREGGEDEVLLSEAQRLDAIFLTTDRDFFHTLRHEYSDHAGMIVVALKKPNRQAILDRLKWLLDNVDHDELRGRAFQLRDRAWIARPPLPEMKNDGRNGVDPDA